ncbi:MAG TPA: hypothetical protein VNH84_14880, partial [Candidatus Saccharimonadales bacterium]|nr:hypothetical protein [Candidatus Saccharimonadales bacterium]
MKLPSLALIAVLTVLRAAAADAELHELTPTQRLAPPQLKATHEAVERFAKERVALPELGALEDFRAVIHVHAEDADHTKGTRQQVLEA